MKMTLEFDEQMRVDLTHAMHLFGTTDPSEAIGQALRALAEASKS